MGENSIVVALSEERLLEEELKDHERCGVINSILAKHPEGFQVKNLLVGYPKLFRNKTQTFRFLIELRGENKLEYERRGDQYFYTEKVNTYNLLNKLWLKSA